MTTAVRQLPASGRNVNAVAGALGIFLVGIFLTWFPISVLRIPLPDHPVDRMAVTGLWQTLMMIVLPYAWAAFRLRMPPSELGITTRNLGTCFALGCALYVIAMAAFVYGRHDPLIADHAVRHVHGGKLWLLGGAMGLIAAGTDIATRGFILLTLAKHGPLWFAILMQNVFWLFGHTHEIQVLTSALGQVGAIGLFVLLGLLGDTIALRTRNVVGLALGHVLLNVAMITFIRSL